MKRRDAFRSLTFPVSSTLLLLFSGSALAQKWYFEPSASLRLGYDDNVRLETEDEEGSFSALLNADARFGFRTEVSDVEFQANLNSSRYDDTGDLDRDNQLLGMNARYRSGLDLFGLKASFLRDSTRTSELESTGFVRKNKRRTKFSLGPSWSRDLTERLALRLGYSYDDVSYENAGDTGLVDYTYHLGDVTLTRRQTEKSDLFGTFSFARYDASNDDDTEFDSLSLLGGLSHRFSETMSGRFAAGLIYTESKFRVASGRDSDDDTALLLDLGLQTELGETLSLEGYLRRTESPTGKGQMLRTNSAGLVVRRKVTERLDFSFSGVVFKNDSAGGFDDPSDERTYFSLEPKLSWRATPWWTVSGSYRYRQQEYTNLDQGEATSNAVFLTVQYVWPRESLAPWMAL